MRRFQVLAIGAVVVFGSAACSTYSTAIDEFDSIAGWDDPQTEPATADYPDVALQYPWFAGFVSSRPVDAPVENPSGFARERITLLADYVSSDLTSMAQVARRLLWVTEADPSALNRLQALSVIESILEILDVDPLDETLYLRDVDSQEQARKEKVFLAADETLRRLFGRAERPAITDADRIAFCDALKAYTSEPLPRLRWQRDLIRTIWSTYVTETDQEVVEVAAMSLRRAMRFAACNGLRAALVPEEIQAKNQPSVRVEVLSIYRRLGGIPAVSFLLNMLRRPQADSLMHRYDQDEQVRMSLVRMCGQLKFEHANVGPSGGQRPIEFLYSTAIDESEGDGLRRIALEGLARCLSSKLGFKMVPVDDEWARAWWKRDVVERRR